MNPGPHTDSSPRSAGSAGSFAGLPSAELTRSDSIPFPGVRSEGLRVYGPPVHIYPLLVGPTRAFLSGRNSMVKRRRPVRQPARILGAKRSSRTDRVGEGWSRVKNNSTVKRYGVVGQFGKLRPPQQEYVLF